MEHLWALRAIPGLDVVRPGDANETAVAWRTILERDDHPAGLCLTRQNIPVLDRADGNAAGITSAEGAARGGYILADAASGAPDVILIATGSEVQIAVAARDLLQAAAASGRGWSPCRAWNGSRSRTAPTGSRYCRRASGRGSAWRRASRCGGAASSGTSAKRQPGALRRVSGAGALYGEFGITAQRVAEAVGQAWPG